MLAFIETRLFSRLADAYLPDDQLARLQHFLSENPEAGISFGSLVASENCAGAWQVEGNAADFESFTT